EESVQRIKRVIFFTHNTHPSIQIAMTRTVRHQVDAVKRLDDKPTLDGCMQPYRRTPPSREIYLTQ
ncbi:MAG: hypothetical protein LBG66_04560, partial [Gallionellaceae bacterium]|nr:hypothetical protein [Gallionellaceae bacterium]